MKLLQVSTFDIAGGAEKVAWALFQAYRARGHGSWLAVGTKRSSDPDVLEIPRSHTPGPIGRGLWRLARAVEWREKFIPALVRVRRTLRILAGGYSEYDRQLGREDFNHPGSRKLLALPPRLPDIVHAHNLHTAYFDLRYLAGLSRRLPVVLTMHDEWLLTGHCAYTLGCTRWQQGCGQCPDLNIYPSIGRDATDWNWKRKRSIYQRSSLRVAAPSRWLHDRISRSMLVPIESRIIPYGVDHEIFRPADRTAVRAELGLPADSVIVLFVAHYGKQNPFKDYATLEQAISRLSAPRSTDRPIVLIALGGPDGEERIGDVQVKSVGFEADARKVARYYQASDLYVHSAHTDNFPNSVLEALACGLPVVASAVGGIPEQVTDGVTGFLTPPRDAEAMAARIDQLLTDHVLRLAMGERAIADSLQRFSMNRQVMAYLDWYAELLESRNGPNNGH